MSFRDQAEYDAFVLYESMFMRVNLANTSSAMIIGNPASANFFSLLMDIPQMKYLTWSTPIGGPNRLVSNFTAKAELDVTSLYMIMARLTNTTSAYI
jgi:hypothetical protein